MSNDKGLTEKILEYRGNYQNGAPIKWIAKETGASHHYVKNVFSRYGITQSKKVNFR